MKLRIKNKNHLFVAIVSAVILIIALVHTSPVLAIRAKLFSEFHFQASLFSSIEPTTSLVYPEVYKVTPAPIEKSTNTKLDVYYVEKTMIIFYYAGYDSGI